MVKRNLGYPQYEQRIYNHVRPIQGKFVPVCIGSVMLKLPYYYDGGVYVSMLFLSWAGRPLFDFLTRENEEYFADKSATALQASHDLQVLQKDPEPQNILWDEHSQRLSFVDLSERRSVLGSRWVSSRLIGRGSEGRGSIMRRTISVLKCSEPSSAFPDG